MFRWEMEEFDTGSVPWCMLEMKRVQLLTACKLDIKNFESKKNIDSTICSSCNILFHYDSTSGDKICKGCGTAVNVILQSTYTRKESSNYTQNCIHHYTFYEHFAQSLVDFANIGNRSVPNDIMNYCRVVLGRGLHVTSHMVFGTLQEAGYSAYYQYKYEIANRLRGKREFILSSEDIRNIRSAFNRYKREIIPYQELKDIGSKSIRGKRRVFWPMRFILARLCEEIGRSDVVLFIRKIASKKRYNNYYTVWNNFVEYVDQRFPKTISISEQPLRKLKQTKHRQQ